MSTIERWWTEAKEVTPVHKTYNSEFLIYKGFKISLVEDDLSILDVRFSNMYRSVHEEYLSAFTKHGFIKGADLISLERDTKRVEFYQKETEKLYDKRAKFSKQLPKNKKLNEKRIKNINLKIDEYIDLIFLYKVKVQQLTLKYNKNE